VTFRILPKLGQNFLVSSAAQAAVADALGDVSHRTVVEIGPGRGAITHILAPRAQRLIAIELDSALAAHLQADFASQPNVTILNQNILTTDLAALATEFESHGVPSVNMDVEAPTLPAPAQAAPDASSGAERLPPLGEPFSDRVFGSAGLLVVGNLPYYITSDILLHLFAAHRVLDRAVVMIQREVADRVAAQPGSRDYGLLSVTAQLYARVEKLLTLPPEAFAPPPQVYSTVLRLTMQPRLEELGLAATPNQSDSAESFIQFLRICFAQKRKTLANNLRAARYDSAAIAAALAACSIKPQSRTEQLSLATLACLHRQLANSRTHRAS
jgi:16S rRNA (adenine1518-N6/adenine1519-N6)-dimethyltransferase